MTVTFSTSVLQAPGTNATGLSAHDEVVVTPQRDESPRKIDVPLELADALSEHARAAFDALSAWRRGAFEQQGESAQAAETRARGVPTIAARLGE